MAENMIDASTELTTILQIPCIINDSQIFGDQLCLTSSPPQGGVPHSTHAIILLGITFIFIVCITLTGNILVICSILLDKRLQSPPNMLIVNLAVADLAVAILVMPLAIAQEIYINWTWTHFLCDVWTTFDVMICTASIMTLCMISVDRYFAITRPFQYAPKRTPRLMLLMIGVVWIISAFISFSALILWGGNELHGNTCIINQDYFFTIYSTFGAFYVPLAVMIIVYYKIYRAAKLSEKTEFQRRPSGFYANSRRGSNFSKGSSGDSDDGSSSERRRSIVKFTGYIINKARPSLVSLRSTAEKHKISLRGERKAAKTLGVIMGAFIVCWLPFFVVALIRPFFNFEMAHALDVVFLWLGYVNSGINPIIYPFFNKEFRPVYKRMLRCECVKVYANQSHFGTRCAGSRSSSIPRDEVEIRRKSKDQNQNGDYRNGDNCKQESCNNLPVNTHVIYKPVLPFDLDKITEASEESGCEV